MKGRELGLGGAAVGLQLAVSGSSVPAVDGSTGPQTSWGHSS